MPSRRGEHGDRLAGETDGLSPRGENTLESVLDRFLAERASGGEPDEERYLREHPGLAAELRGVFRTLDFVEATSRSMHGSLLEPGAAVGEFRIVREVGRGGMGVVYEAVQTTLQRRVALKVLGPGATLSPHAPERFALEAETAGRLHHSNIVPIHAVGEHEGMLYFAMQYISGRSLAWHLGAWRGDGVGDRAGHHRRVAGWGRQVAEALEHAHSHGAIHRDIKPANLLLDDDDRVWLTDFGLAREDARATITVSGDVVGTARYMSPEQARGGRLDGRSDIYSLGATLYELLALSPAIDGDSRELVLNRLTTGAPRPLRQADAAIPRDLERVIAKCLAREPEGRYQRAGELAEDLRRYLHGEPILARRTPLRVRATRLVRRHRLRLAGVVALLALVAAVLVIGRAYRLEQGRHALGAAQAALLLEHDSAGASRLLDRAERWGIRSAEVHLYRGLIPLFSAQPQRAISPLAEALHLDPANTEAQLAMAYALYNTGDEVGGRRFEAAVPEDAITTPLGWLLRGHTLGISETADSVAAYDRALAVRPDFTPAIEARAQARGQRLLVEGDRDQLGPMLDDFEAWVRFWPASSRSYAARGAGFTRAAAYAATQPDLAEQAPVWLERARADYDRALELEAANPAEVLVRRGSHRRYVGDFEGSAADFARAIELDRAANGGLHPGYAHHQALALHAMGRTEEALAAVEPACEELPSFVPLALQRAMLLAEAGRMGEARRVCREAAARQSGGVSGALLCAAVMDLLGDSETARETARRAGVGAPGDALIAWYAGVGDGAGLLSGAGASPGDRCRYALALAAWELGQGRRASGSAAVDACLATGLVPYAHHRFAQVFRARLDADPAWPAWVSRTDG
jgi:tetratricopeptide (TPR) repeat protein